MKIDYSKVVGKEYYTKMNEERLSYLKEKGEIHSHLLRGNYIDTYANDMAWITQRANEIVYTQKKYSIFSEEEKQILASNIVFEDRKVIEALLNKGINYNTLYYYSTLISKLKKVVALADKLNISDEVVIANKKINYICSIIRLYFGVDNFTLIATKLNEIAATQKNLYMEIEKAKIRR